MTDNVSKTRFLAASAVCVLSSLMGAGPAMTGDVEIRVAASDSYWCRMFPKFCGDEGTPGGVQNIPTPAGAPSAPSTSDSDAGPPPEEIGNTEAHKPPPPPPSPSPSDVPKTQN